MSDVTDDVMVAMMVVPLASLAVLVGECATAAEHADVTGLGLTDPVGMRALENTLTSATAVWATRRHQAGALSFAQMLDIEATVLDARAWLTDHPAELAEHDQQFAAFVERMRGA